MHNEALSVREATWISHGDVNLKMRKKRVMVPLGSDGLLRGFHGKKHNNTLLKIKWSNVIISRL